jgi:hypothetical protein
MRPLLACLAVAAACGPEAATEVDAPPADAAADARLIDAVPIDSPDAPPPPDVEVVVTADNAYSFGYGDDTGIGTYIQGTRAVTAGQIFNCPIGEGPERYVVPGASAPDTAYLYIVSWDDLRVTQGVLGQFRRGAGAPVYTGGEDWQVCATGIDLSASANGPTQAEVNAQIAICNAGTGAPGTTSRGWVNTVGAVTAGALGTLAIGEPNDGAAGDFPLVCPASMGGIDASARWMWYQPGGVANPFRSTGTNTFRAYLIFRLPTVEIPIG